MGRGEAAQTVSWLIKVDIGKASDGAILHFVVGLTTDRASRRRVMRRCSVDEQGKSRDKRVKIGKGGIVASFVKAATSFDGPRAEGISNIVLKGNFLMGFDVRNKDGFKLGSKLSDLNAYRD